MTADISVKEAAAQFGCSPQTVQAWINAGKLKAYKLGGHGAWRIPQAEIDRVRNEWIQKPEVKL